MARDYKYRTENRGLYRRGHGSVREAGSMALWRWMLITALIIGIVVLLFYLGTKGESSAGNKPLRQSDPTSTQGGTQPENGAEMAAAKQPEVKPEPHNPQFEFYTVLTDEETVVPDHEIDTRSREERVGQARTTQYHLQAGSYREFKEADQIRANLALMGIESRIEKAKVGNVIWHRIKIGPYARMSSVDAIRSRLRVNGIDAIVIEPGR
ncbi:MAG: SPOR domain-containing protein [Gammaproteobacteria bacterium]